MHQKRTLSTATSSSHRRQDLRAALVEVLDQLRHEQASVLILSPVGVPEVFVQCIVTDVGLLLEAVSNVFLGGSDQALDQRQTRLLEDLGWNPPHVPNHPDERPDGSLNESPLAVNWWLAVSGPDDLERSADLLLTTLVGVYRHLGEATFEVASFPADCQEWTWADDHLVALDA